MKIICVKFNGGLGNQLFQYANAISHLKKNDLLFFDIRNYENDYLGRQFSILKFDIKGKKLTNSYLIKIFSEGTKLNIFFSKLGLVKIIRENGFFYDLSIQHKIKSFTIFEGFWQTEKYFMQVRNKLLSEFIPLNIPSLPSVFVEANTVAVHVRRTDYISNIRYGFLGKVYYIKAIEFMKNELENPTFIFFSDDLKWCEENFKGANLFFFKDSQWNEDFEQLYLISKCNHQIIANSSFSWWGAWLNNYAQKIVVRPSVPFNDVALLYENYYPDDWVSINN